LASCFQQLLSAEFLTQALSEARVKSNNGVYSPLVVLWLLVAQRLQCGTSMEAAVVELLRGLPTSFWPHPCKRIREWREQGKAPSSHTGAYNQARQALPLSVVQKSSDHIFQQLVVQLPQSAATPAATPTFVLDGSTMRAPHTPELCRAYPPTPNQYGESHWPLLRVLVAHDLHTGLAMRPEWGPVNGPQAVSEQALLERAIDRLPARAVVVGDANFGVFSVAHAATQRQHPVVLRLTAERARSMAGEAVHDGIDRALVWKPTPADRKKHPELPPTASIAGRLQVRQVQPNDGAPFLLALFTTTSPADDAFQIYGQRWSIETDLRTLKSTLSLDQLVCATPDMVAKEIDLGYVAYNLVRAFIGFASERSGIPPRGYSFTKVRLILETFGPLLANAPDPESRQRIMNQVMTFIQQSKLPRRQRKRPSTPRTVWSKGSRYPSRKKP